MRTQPSPQTDARFDPTAPATQRTAPLIAGVDALAEAAPAPSGGPTPLQRTDPPPAADADGCVPARMDASGRIAVAAAAHALGWQRGQTVHAVADPDRAVVTLAADPADASPAAPSALASLRLDTKDRVRLPLGLRRVLTDDERCPDVLCVIRGERGHAQLVAAARVAGLLTAWLDGHATATTENALETCEVVDLAAATQEGHR